MTDYKTFLEIKKIIQSAPYTNERGITGLARLEEIDWGKIEKLLPNLGMYRLIDCWDMKTINLYKVPRLIFEKMLKEGLDIYRDRIGGSFLETALRSKDSQTVKLLLDKGVDYKKNDVYGHPMMWLAAQHNNADSIRFLLENGVNPDEKLFITETDKMFYNTGQRGQRGQNCYVKLN